MKKKIIYLIATIVLLMISASFVLAAPVYNSDTGNYYELIITLPGGISWNDAKIAAESSSYIGMTGYLATIHSDLENEFIAYTLGANGNHWLGGYQPSGSPEPDGGWQWVTGEPWSYTSWNGGEPNNNGEGGAPENALTYWGYGTGWNDYPDYYKIDGYVVEYGATVVPEPISSILFLTGGATLIGRRYLKRKV